MMYTFSELGFLFQQNAMQRLLLRERMRALQARDAWNETVRLARIVERLRSEAATITALSDVAEFDTSAATRAGLG